MAPKKWKILCLQVAIIMIAALSCRAIVNGLPVNNEMIISDYIFRVDHAAGDRHNVRITYSLKRTDGGEVGDKTHFSSLHSGDILTTSELIKYQLSEDGKTLWIEEIQSSPVAYNPYTAYTVILDNLVQHNGKIINGSWNVRYYIQVDRKYQELLKADMTISLLEDGIGYCHISSIQLSKLGIHIDMFVEECDIEKLASNFQSQLIFKDGSTEKLECSYSLRENGKASVEAMFDGVVALDTLQAVTICGQDIFLNHQS